jgi:NTE family protein
MSRKPKIGLALGGGGARGLAHVGVLKILEKNNIKLDFICGVSMGALIASAYACGMSVEEMEEEATSLNKRTAIRKLLDLSNPKRSLLKGRKTKNAIQEFVRNKNFSDCRIPLEIITTNLATGDEYIINRGKVADAVLASLSVPGIFPPVKIGPHYLIDGGVANPTPVDRLEKNGMDVLIGVDLMIKRKIEFDKDPGMVTTLIQAYEIIRTKAIRYNMRLMSKDTILIMPKIQGTINSFKFYDIDKFIRAGEEAAKEMMPIIKQRIEEESR